MKSGLKHYFRFVCVALATNACGAADEAAFRLTAGPATGNTADGTAGDQYRVGRIALEPTEEGQVDTGASGEQNFPEPLDPALFTPIAPVSYLNERLSESGRDSFPHQGPETSRGGIPDSSEQDTDASSSPRSIAGIKPGSTKNSSDQSGETPDQPRGNRHSSPHVVGIIPSNPKPLEPINNLPSTEGEDDEEHNEGHNEGHNEEPSAPRQDQAGATSSPLCTGDCNIEPSRKTLWPPNGKMVAVELSGIDAAACAIIDVSDDETNLVSDFRITGEQSLELRAKRSGTSKNGRTYTIELECDTSEGQSYPTLSVQVVHDQGKIK